MEASAAERRRRENADIAERLRREEEEKAERLRREEEEKAERLRREEEEKMANTCYYKEYAARHHHIPPPILTRVRYDGVHVGDKAYQTPLIWNQYSVLMCYRTCSASASSRSGLPM